MAATPQQMHALIQVIYNLLKKNKPVSEEEKHTLIPHKEALCDLVEPKVPDKTKKKVLVQERTGFIPDLSTPVIRSLGLLML